MRQDSPQRPRCRYGLPRVALGCLLGFLTSGATARDGLLDIYARALEQDPRVNIARYQVEIGEAQKDTARGGLLPQVAAAAQLTDNQITFDGPGGTSEDYPGERYSLQVRQMLLNWQAMSAHARSKRVLDQRENELLDALGQLSVDVAERYFNVLLADDNVRLLEAEKTLLERQLEQTEALYDRGLARVTDVLETKARADSVRTDLVGAENEAALAREELAVLTGGTIEELVPLREDFELPELEGSMNDWVARAEASNPLLESKQDAVLAARNGVEERRAGHLPTVDLVYTWQRSDVGFDNLQAPRRDVEFIGLDVNVPLFSGGATSARLREAWSNFYIAREEEEGVRREVVKRVRSAWLNAGASRRRLDAARLSMESAETAYKAMRKALELGTARTTDLLEALHQQTLARRDYRQAVYGYVFHWLSLQRESGELDGDDLDSVERGVLRSPPRGG